MRFYHSSVTRINYNKNNNNNDNDNNNCVSDVRVTRVNDVEDL